MSFRNGIKAAVALSLTAMLAGCSSTPAEPQTVNILCPTGAPALSLLGLAGEEDMIVNYVEGQDVLAAELNKTDGEYDLIVAPINLGVKSWSESKAYTLDSVVTWGNLYLVADTDKVDSSPDEWTDEITVAAFGQGAVPGLVFGSVDEKLAARAEQYPSVAEASQALLSQKADAALLAQPVVTAAIAKYKEMGFEARVVQDLQEAWQTKYQTDEKGYPQAAIFVKKGSEKKVAEALDEIGEFLETPQEGAISSAVDEIGAETIGVPNAQIAEKAWDGMNIHYRKAADVQNDISTFLEHFNIELPDDIIAK